MICRGCPSTINSVKSHCDKKCNCDSLNVFDWMNEIVFPVPEKEFVEVQFKNTRKGFFINQNKLQLEKGDIVTVEASPGHDIGIVSLRGPLVFEQMRKYNEDPNGTGFKIIYRKTKPADIEKWLEAVEQETPIMHKARKMAENLNLDMKIGDVEYQSDKTRAVFYYTAEERVDFRELIKLLAEEFKVRVEMRQIGARQEAGKIGGLGPCGRKLCCNTWLSKFKSVTTHAARIQETNLNPQKLAGQCSKLKCCLNYEMDCYTDARRDFPDLTQTLSTIEGKAYYQKADIFSKIIWYSLESDENTNMIAVPLSRAKEIIEMNSQGQKPKHLVTSENASIPEISEYKPTETDSITRFDKATKKKGKKGKKGKKKLREDEESKK